MKKKKDFAKELLVVLSVAVAVAVFVAVIDPVLLPRRTDFGSTWGQYLEEPENSIDALFFGSSITYCDVAPAAIWESSGISSYVMAGPEQTVPISYYYLKECCKTQSPKAVFLEVTGVFFQRYQSFSKVNVGYMPAGLNRLQATFLATEREEWAGLLFPPYNYHSRWDQMTEDEIDLALGGYDTDIFAGYTFLDAARPITGAQPRGEVLDEKNYSKNIAFLQKIADFCKKESISAVFYIAPTYWPLSIENRELLERDISKIDGAVFVDFNSDEGLPAFDTQRDFYDLLHFNCFGAEKFSTYLGNFMTERLGLSPSQNADPALWQQRADYLHLMMPADPVPAED